MLQLWSRSNEIRKRERNQSNLRPGDPIQDNGNRPHQVSLLEAILLTIEIVNNMAETVLIDPEDPVDFQQYKTVVHKL